MENNRTELESKIPLARDSSMELLRIIAMVMIVFHHFALHGGFSWDTATITIPQLWWDFILMGGQMGVDIFVLISGYYLCTGKGIHLNAKKLLKFWGQVVFYSVGILLIVVLAGNQEIGVRAVIEAFFPITFEGWWFSSAYFVLFLLHPFLNWLLHTLSKKSCQLLLALLVICWSVIPTLTNSDFQSNSLLWFMTLYLIAGYVRIYGLNRIFSGKFYFAMWGLFSLVTFSICVFFQLLGTKESLWEGYSLCFYGRQKLNIFLAAFSLFMAFTTLKRTSYKGINLVASAAFGVYLIHDNNYVRPFLWMTLFKNAQYQDSLVLIPYSVAVVFIVYIVCTLIDLGRKRFLEPLYMKLVNAYADTLLKPVKAIWRHCAMLLFGE